MDEPVAATQQTVAAFVGRALRGPMHTPVLLASFHQFCQRFGDPWNRSALGPAVQQFFAHGGSRLYVVRVANGAGGAVIRVPVDCGLFELRAIEPGSSERIRASIDYDRLPDDETRRFNLTVQRIAPGSGTVQDQEFFTAVSCDPDADDYVVDRLLDSGIVRGRVDGPTGRPKATIGPGIGANSAYVSPVERGSDGSELTDYDLVGSATAHRGLFALDAVDQFDLLYLPSPRRGHNPGPAALLAAERYCRKRGAMLIVDPPRSWNTASDVLADRREALAPGSNLLTYFPRMLSAAHPAEPRAVGGAIAGLLCRLDARRGPWERLDQPGFEFARELRPAIDLSDREKQGLVRAGVNVISATGKARAALCGSVTMAHPSLASLDDQRFVSLEVRRLCLHISNAVAQGTRWSVFHAGGARIAHQVRGQVHAFLAGLAARGAFERGRFDVHCESGLHLDPRDPLRGVTILIAVQPAGCGRSLWLTLHQTVQGCRVATTAFAPTGA